MASEKELQSYIESLEKALIMANARVAELEVLLADEAHDCRMYEQHVRNLQSKLEPARLVGFAGGGGGGFNPDEELLQEIEGLIVGIRRMYALQSSDMSSNLRMAKRALVDNAIRLAGGEVIDPNDTPTFGMPPVEWLS